MKIIELFESEDFKTLYCSRELLNGEDLVKWAEDQGFKKCLDPKDMHVTIAYSKKKVDWAVMTDSFDHIQSTINKKHPEKTKREVKQFDGGAIVLTFENGDLHHRWEEFKDDFGASWDYPDYHPHITITYSGLPDGKKIGDIEPFEGKLEFGPEIMKELDLNWKAKEKKLDESELYFLQPDGGWKKNADGRSEGRTKAEVEKLGGKIVEGYSQATLQGWAAGHEGTIYEPDHELGGAASDWTWKYYPALPVSKFIGEMSADGWKQWMEGEIRDRKHDYDEDDYYGGLTNGSKIKEPITVVERDGKMGIWDGWHRIGSSFLIGRQTLPAIVGTRKTVEEAAPAVDPTETKQFKEWFRGSKVVGSDGKPLVVYHGTSKKFRAFNIKKSTMPVIWFTSDKAAIEAGEVGAQGAGHILELYASVQNPADWKAYDQLMLVELKSRGYDGAILPDRNGHFNGFVFDATQLKSATKNNGNYDRHNKNLAEDDEEDDGDVS